MDNFTDSFVNRCVRHSYPLLAALELVFMPAIYVWDRFPGVQNTSYLLALLAVAQYLLCVAIPVIFLGLGVLVTYKLKRESWKWCALTSLSLLVVSFAAVLALCLRPAIEWFPSMPLLMAYMAMILLLGGWYLYWLIRLYVYRTVKFLSWGSLLSILGGVLLAILPALFLSGMISFR